jgi:glyoxylase-like metal-dependent hydrolase (beta-lactamase superfamily II)
MPATELPAFHERVSSSVPDLAIEQYELAIEGELACVTWRASGTFSGEPFLGVAPGGQRVELELCDVLRIESGRITRANTYFDCSLLAAQIGGLPGLIAGELEEIADGVWVLRGGYPLPSMNVYFIRDGTGVTVFDTGPRAIAGAVKAAADQLGGAVRTVLGHGHSDHRGGAVALGAPVLCHPNERADAEGDGGLHYMDVGRLTTPARWVMGMFMRAYDGPAPAVSGSLVEGDTVAGFEVIELPGHAPGLIGLWRERDRLALVSDCFYLTDMDQLGKPGPARVPHAATSLDLAQAAASIRKLADLRPAAAWPGHMGPLTGDVRAELLAAAER